MFGDRANFEDGLGGRGGLEFEVGVAVGGDFDRFAVLDDFEREAGEGVVGHLVVDEVVDGVGDGARDETGDCYRGGKY